MSHQIGPTVEKLVRRVRQEGGTAVPLDLACEIYSLCEQTLNTHLGLVTATSTVSIPKQKLVFEYRSIIPNAIDIKSIRQSNRRIEKISFPSMLSAYDIDWFRTINGTQFECWCQVGRDILLLYPGQAAISSIEIEFVKLLPLHTDFSLAYTTTSELPTEYSDISLSLAETILMARFRQFDGIKEQLASITSRLKKGPQL